MTLSEKSTRAAGWEINIPFQHKNRIYREQGIGWRFSSARLRMANDTSTTQNGKG